jgi:hypothetical protein
LRFLHVFEPFGLTLHKGSSLQHHKLCGWETTYEASWGLGQDQKLAVQDLNVCVGELRRTAVSLAVTTSPLRVSSSMASGRPEKIWWVKTNK